MRLRLLRLAGAVVLAGCAAVPQAAAFGPAGEGFATSSTGHVAVLSAANSERTAVHVAGPDLRFAAPERVPEGEFLAVGPRGDVLVVGHTRIELPPKEPGQLEVEFRVWAAYRPPGGPLGPRVELGLSRAYGENWPALALDEAGTGVVLWTSADEPERLMASIRRPDGEWVFPQPLGGPASFRPILSGADNGLMTAVWQQRRSTGAERSQAAVATKLPGGVFGPATVVAGVQRDPGEPTLAANAAGDAVVVWQENFERPPRNRWDLQGGVAIHGAFRKGLGAFGRPQRLSEIEAAFADVAVAPSGRMVMAWNGGSHIEARIRSAGGVLRPAQRVTHDVYGQEFPAVLPQGGGLVVWKDRDPGVSFARVASADAAGRFGRARTIGRGDWLGDPILLLTSQRGLRYVTAFGRRGRPLLQTLPVPTR